MTRVTAVTALLALALGSAAPAAAAADKPRTSDPLAVEALYNYAECAVARTPQGARTALAKDFRTSAYRSELSKFARGHSMCSPNAKLRFTGILFAGDVAEALLRRDVPANGLAARVAQAPAADVIAPRNASEAMALCAVRAAPDQAQALFAAAPVSDAEKAAFAAFTPAIQGCVTRGQTVEMTRPELRAVLALATYRLARPDAATVASKG